MQASLNNYRQSPRKVRLVADLVRGKRVAEAEAELKNLTKRAALPLAKTLRAAIANAAASTQVSAADRERLVVKSVRVDKGPTLKRIRPRARGTASRINKRTSHISVTLGL